MIGLKDDEAPTYDKWRENLSIGYNHPGTTDSWIAIGDWLFNAKDNVIYDKENVAYHLCINNYNRIYHPNQSGRPSMALPSVSPIEDGCAMCKVSMPDGIKMIALLEKL